MGNLFLYLKLFRWFMGFIAILSAAKGTEVPQASTSSKTKAPVKNTDKPDYQSWIEKGLGR